MQLTELTDREARWAALLLVDLMLRPKDWIHRRVETAVFEDHQSAKRRVLVDFSIPEPSDGLKASFPSDEKKVTLPVAIMRKRRMRVFQLEDESGRHWPVLTRHTRARIAQSALVLLGEAELDGSLHDQVKADLETMAGEAVPVAYELHRRFLAAAKLSDEVLSKADEDVRQRAALYRNTAFRLVAYTLVWSYVLLVQMPNDPGKRCSLSFSYEDRPIRKPRRDAVVSRWVAEEQRSKRRERARWRMRQFARMFGRSLGWSPRRFVFPCNSVVYGQSYHFEVEAPSGCQISSSVLYVTSDWSPRRDPYRLSIDEAVGLKREQAADWERGSVPRSHLYVRDSPDNGQGVAQVEVRAERSTLVQGIFLTALLSVLLLGAALHFRTKFHVDAATTLLLLLPTALVVYVVQPSSEHGLVAQLLIAVRGFGVLVGLCLIAAAGALVVAPAGDPPSLLALKLAFGVAAAATLVLFGAWIQARRRRYRSPLQGDR